MDRRVQKPVRRRPLSQWAGAALAAAAILQAAQAAAPDAPLIQAAPAANQTRPALRTGPALPSLAPYSALVFGSRRFPLFGDSPDGWHAYAGPLLAPPNPLEERFQAAARGTQPLLAFPVGTGRFSLVWQHGANMGAYLRFDDRFARPSLELTERNGRKITFAVSLHW